MLFYALFSLLLSFSGSREPWEEARWWRYKIKESSLSHTNLHAANIFVDDDRSMSVTAIIDWQGAVVRPLFETTIPDFVNINIENLQYVKIPGDLQHPVETRVS